jgi:Rod binding domain-containing protein
MKISSPQDAMTLSKLSSPTVPSELKTGRKESPEQVMAAAQSFEAIFVNQLLKSMRSTLPEDGLMESSFAKNTFTEMLDKEYAQMASKSRSFGLADMIARQFGINPDDLKTAVPDQGGDSLNATPDLKGGSYSINHHPNIDDSADAFEIGRQKLNNSSKEVQATKQDEYGEDIPAWAFSEIKEGPVLDEALWQEDGLASNMLSEKPQEAKQTEAKQTEAKQNTTKATPKLNSKAKQSILPTESMLEENSVMQLLPGLSPPKQSQALKAYQELLAPEIYVPQK